MNNLWFPVILALGLASCAAPTREPRNLTHLKTELKSYVDSKDYEHDLEKATAPAKAWIAKRAPQVSKPAVVFDIDETALSNLHHMLEEDWGYQPNIWDDWVAGSSAPAIEPVRGVYQTALDHKVAVFFVTGRKESDRRATAINLKRQGMGDYVRLIVRPVGNKQPADVFKPEARKRIADEGYTIIANLGDQHSDLSGGYSERTFKLTNPFYYIK